MVADYLIFITINLALELEMFFVKYILPVLFVKGDKVGRIVFQWNVTFVG